PATASAKALPAVPAWALAGTGALSETDAAFRAGRAGGALGLAVAGSRRIMVWRVKWLCALRHQFCTKTHSLSATDNER
ncbi:DUF1403 family protein, partial [Mesorhizobium sp. M7A.F.Ca.US.001.04.2.1]